ncbi:MAG: PDZ domain-containing protein, partial [Heliobacteriaceae bacterium]|nr:PDZ domain-containing protein [Heliobacteriaceae bacterium]
MEKHWVKKVCGTLLAFLLISASLTEEAFCLWLIPSQLRTVVGAEVPIQRMFPENVLRHVTLDIQRINLPAFQSMPASPENQEATFAGLTTGEIVEPGRFNLTLRLMGFIPLKKIIVDVLPPVELIPGGHSIGVMLHSAGVLVVGQAPVVDEAGQKQYPAKQAGIQVGDTINRVNGQVIKSDSELAKIIQEAGQTGQAVELEWSRNGQLY